MKRAIPIFLVLCLLLSTTNVASARASDYIDSYNITVSMMGNGVVRVQATVACTTPLMTTVGFPTIKLFEYDGSKWVAKVTHIDKYNPTKPSGSYAFTFDYQGTAGKLYYAYSSYIVGNANGSDWRELNSASVNAT